MRFKIEQDGIHFFLSDREVEKYGLRAENVIKDNDMPFKMTDGNHVIHLNGLPLSLQSQVAETESGYKVEVRSNGHTFAVEKITEINKYDVFRHLAKNYRNIVKKGAV
jgi:hypothetical protein